jgi:iron complex transport system permease protein
MSRERSPLTRRRLLAGLAGGGALLALALLAGTAFGPSGVGLEAFAAGAEEVERVLLVEVRLPRVLAAAVLGAALALAGVAFQALLRNPLADPYVLGVSGGASLAGALALVAGLATALLPVAAFAGALATLVALERLARIGGRLDVYTLLLTGAVFNATSAALLLFLQNLAAREELHALVFYLMGRVPILPRGELVLFTGVVVAAAALFAARGRELNALALGEEGAMQLGIDVERLKRAVLVVASLLTGLAVARAGLVGFVGLVVPHLLRLLVGPDHRLLAPLSALGGAAALVAADLVARVALAPRELPVGAVTALVGGPFFLALLRRRGRERHV